MSKVIITDDNGKEVKVNIKKFYNHIQEYHSSGTSVHEEQGHFFTINQRFRNRVKELLDSSKQKL